MVIILDEEEVDRLKEGKMVRVSMPAATSNGEMIGIATQKWANNFDKYEKEYKRERG